MEVVYARCGGLDVHKRTVVACVVVPGPGPRPRKEVRTFGTMTDDLLRLADWLAEHQVTHVAMESTGVYWSTATGRSRAWRSTSTSSGVGSATRSPPAACRRSATPRPATT